MVLVLLLIALAAILAAAVVIRHFLPLVRNPGVPKGSFGWPIVGETIGFLRPHPSNTTGGFLQDRIARYVTYSYACWPCAQGRISSSYLVHA